MHCRPMLIAPSRPCRSITPPPNTRTNWHPNPLATGMVRWASSTFAVCCIASQIRMLELIPLTAMPASTIIRRVDSTCVVNSRIRVMSSFLPQPTEIDRVKPVLPHGRQPFAGPIAGKPMW